ncbi:MAG: hypothetical protein KKD39_00795 [Candidatus Altiarchaeota archaeon]|nr:hypothetical protein [Candidatus Altiarchaeota archaeon]
MTSDSVIVRYGEIFLKSPYVRGAFTARLVSNIREKTKRHDVKVHVGRHRIFLKTYNADAVADEVSSVFGVKSASPSYSTDSDFEMLSKKVIEVCEKLLGANSFAVRARRSSDYIIKSQELERRLGALIVERFGNRVDLTKPDMTVGVEIQGDNAYVFLKTLQCVGGLPYGTQAAVAAHVASRNDALACWMMMRRGCTLAYAGGVEYLEKLNDFATPKMKAYESLDEAVKLGGAHAVVVGETFENIDYTRERSYGVPVFRPLLALDKVGVERLMASSKL